MSLHVFAWRVFAAIDHSNVASEKLANIESLSDREVLQLLVTEVSALKADQGTLANDVASLQPREQVSEPTAVTVSDNTSSTAPDTDAQPTQSAAHPRSDDRVGLQPRSIQAQQNSGDSGPTIPNLGESAATDCEAQYWALNETLKHLRLQPDLVLKDNHKGFKKETQPVARVVTRSARYVETGLKLLSCCEPSKEVEDLTLVLTAHLDFLKCEYSCLVVANDNTKEVAQNYRRIKAGTTGMSGSDLQDLKLAQEITAHSAASGPQERDRGRDSYRGGRFGNRGRGQYNQRGRGQEYSLYRNLVRSNDQLPSAPQNRNDD